MCKNSGEAVKRLNIIHIKFTIDRIIIVVIVINVGFIQYLLDVFDKLILCIFSFILSLMYRFTTFPHKLLLLLLSINLNIINKNLRNEVKI